MPLLFGGVQQLFVSDSAVVGVVHFNTSPTVTFGISGQTVTASAAGAQGGGSVNFSAGTTSNNLASVVFGNGSGVSFGLANGTITGTVQTNYLTTAMLSNAGSDYVQAVAAFAGTSASGTIASNGISISVGAYLTTAAASNHSHGNPTLALTNLSGTTASASNGLTLSLSAAAPGGGGAVSFSAGTASAALGSLVFSDANGVSFGLNGSTITASANAGGGGAPNRRYIEVMQGERLTTIRNLSDAAFSRRPIFMPFWLDGTGLEVSTVRLMVSGAASSNRSLRATFGVALYSAANATQLSLIGTASLGYNITASSQSSMWNGPRIMDFTGMNVTMTTEGRWVLALSVSATTHNISNCNMPIYGADNMPSISGYLVSNTSVATNATNQVLPFWGVYSATTAGFPASVGLAQINGGNSASLLDAYAIIKEI